MSDPAQAEETLNALCARVSSITEALRFAAQDADARAIEQALLSDLARLAAMLRNDATVIGESLARALEPGTAPSEKERSEA